MKTVVCATALLLGSVLILVGQRDRPRSGPPSFTVNWQRVLARHRDLPVAVEPSTRLAVPQALAEDVWSFLRARRAHLWEADRIRQATDWHYDTGSNRLAEQWVAVRLRSGNGRPKVQLKAYDRQRGHAAEITFPVHSVEPRPLWDLLTESDRPVLLEALRIVGVGIHDLTPGPPLFHARRELPLIHDGTAMTVSLDHLTWAGGEHHVLELTPRADQTDHDGVAALIRELRAVFPTVSFDPRPKVLTARAQSPDDDDESLWRVVGLVRQTDITPSAAVAPTPETQAMPQHQRAAPPFALPIGTYAVPLGTGL